MATTAQCVLRNTPYVLTAVVHKSVYKEFFAVCLTKTSMYTPLSRQASSGLGEQLYRPCELSTTAVCPETAGHNACSQAIDHRRCCAGPCTYLKIYPLSKTLVLEVRVSRVDCCWCCCDGAQGASCRFNSNDTRSILNAGAVRRKPSVESWCQLSLVSYAD